MCCVCCLLFDVVVYVFDVVFDVLFFLFFLFCL